MSPVTRKELIFDIARSWATIDGNRAEFDTCAADPEAEDRLGRYEGYMTEAETLIELAPSLKRILDFIDFRDTKL